MAILKETLADEYFIYIVDQKYRENSLVVVLQ